MPETKYFLNNLWLWKCNLPEQQLIKNNINICDLYKSEWSVKFEKLMRNRLVMGALRYSKLHCIKPKYDRVSSIQSRLNNYKITKNKEYLVDIANLCLIEFEEEKSDNHYFKSIDDGEHVKIVK